MWRRSRFEWWIKSAIFLLRSLLATSSSTDPAVSAPTIVCCNGGIPYVSVNLTFSDFKPINSSDLQPDCTLYVISLKGGLSNVRPNLACRCRPGSSFHGDQCDSKKDDPSADAVVGNNEYSSFKIFLFIAIIPLSFALLAGFGAFLCRMCFCDCFDLHDYCKRCWSKDPYNLESTTDLANEALTDRRFASYRYEIGLERLESASDERRGNERNSAALFNDLPPSFNSLRLDQSSDHRQTVDTVITMQPKLEGRNSMYESCHRKCSPPPAYSTVVGQSTCSNKDAATQTGKGHNEI